MKSRVSIMDMRWNFSWKQKCEKY